MFFFLPKCWLQYACSQLCFWKLCPPPWRKQVFQGCTPWSRSTGIAPENIPGPKKEAGSPSNRHFSGARLLNFWGVSVPGVCCSPMFIGMFMKCESHKTQGPNRQFGDLELRVSNFLIGKKYHNNIYETAMHGPALPRVSSPLKWKLTFRGFSILPAKSCCTYHPGKPLGSATPIVEGTSFLSFGGCNLTISTTLLLPCLIFCLLGVHQWHLILLRGRIWKARKGIMGSRCLRGLEKIYENLKLVVEIFAWESGRRGKRYQFTVLKDEPSSFFSKESKKSWGCFHNNTCIYLLILEPNDTSGRVSQVWFQLVKAKFPTTLYNQHQDTGWIIGLG